MTDKNLNQGFTVIVNSPGNIIASGSENISMSNNFFCADVSCARRWEYAKTVEPIDITVAPPVQQEQSEQTEEDTPCRRQAADPSLLSPYVNDADLRNSYASRLSLCCTARNLGKVVCDMIFDGNVYLHREEAVKKKFIDGTLREYAICLTSGTSTDNIRHYINDAFGHRKREEERNQKLKPHVR